MAEFQLHCFAQSGNAFKAATMLQLCDGDWQPVFVDFFGGQTRDPAWRAEVNEMGEVPVLVHGQRKISQTGAILDYLARHFGRFLPANDDLRREVWRWILWDNHKHTSYVGTERFMRHLMKQGRTPVVEFFQGRIAQCRAILEVQLEGRDWLVGSEPTIADLSVSGYLFYPEEELGVDWREFPAISAWLDRLRAMPGWVHPYELMPGADKGPR